MGIVCLGLLSHAAARALRFAAARPLTSGGFGLQLQMMITRVADEEYDAALARTPELCRPFAAVMGDLRPAAQVRADFDTDRSLPLAALSSTTEGRRALDLLAAALRSRGAALGGVQRRPILLDDESVL